MFSGLANYLFGSTNSDTNIDKKENENKIYSNDYINNKPVTDKFTFLSIETDDEDWLIIDKEEEESLPQTDSEEELPFVEIKNSSKFPRSRTYQRNHNRSDSVEQSNIGHLANNNNNRIQQHQLRNNDRTSQPLYVAQSTALAITPYTVGIVHHMEESWFLTPPPCFTSTEPVNMETSPFENLLIEHPSMSVYRSIRSAQEAGADFESDIEHSQLRPTTNRSSVRVMPVVHRNMNRVEHLTKQQFKENLLLRNSQKVQENKERQNNCSRAIKRANKVREINSKGRRQRRSDQQHCKIISGANNNRKC